MSTAPSPHTLRWLHVSDLHLGSEDGYGHDIVLRALVEAFRDGGTLAERRPDVIFCTGDVAQSGKPPQYAAAGQFFEQLAAATRVPLERVFVVPGNHDIERTRIAKSFTLSIDDREAADVFFGPDGTEDREIAFRRFSAYADFQRDRFSLPISAGHPYLLTRCRVGAEVIGVIGLNTAWLAHQDEAQGKLVIGERLLRNALEHISGARSAALDVEDPPVPGAKYEEAFYVPRGREELAAARLRRSGTPLVIVGPKWMGKSWLVGSILQIVQKEPDHPKVLTVRLDDADDGLQSMARQLALQHSAIPEGGDVSPKKLTEMLKTILVDAPGRLIMIVDVQEGAERHASMASVFDALRIWNDQNNHPPWEKLRLLLSARSRKPPLRGSLLAAPPIVVGRFSDAEARELAARHGFRGEEHAEAICSLAVSLQGHPYLLASALHDARWFGQDLNELVTTLSKRGQLPEEGMLQSHLIDLRARLIEPEHRTLATTLRAIALGSSRAPDADACERLRDLGLIEHSGETWRLCSPTFYDRLIDEWA